jgi:hypothetical protein
MERLFNAEKVQQKCPTADTIESFRRLISRRRRVSALKSLLTDYRLEIPANATILQE